MSIALITGASRGLGRSMALHLADKGHDVIITYHSKKDDADEVVSLVAEKGRKGVALQLDVAEHGTFEGFAASVRALLRETFEADRIDSLINNAGIGLHKPFAETTAEELDSMIDIHLKAPFLLSQLFLPMIRDGGHVVNVSSGLARFSLPGYSAYAMMKGAIEVMTRYMAAELGERRIRVNTIAPGAIATDFGGGAVRDVQEVKDMVSSVTALGRPGEADEIGSAVAALVSGDLDWVNGQRIEASGGMFL